MPVDKTQGGLVADGVVGKVGPLLVHVHAVAVQAGLGLNGISHLGVVCHRAGGPQRPHVLVAGGLQAARGLLRRGGALQGLGEVKIPRHVARCVRVRQVAGDHLLALGAQLQGIGKKFHPTCQLLKHMHPTGFLLWA